MDIHTEHSLISRLLQPQTAFTIACLSFTILAVVAVWRNHEVTHPQGVPGSETIKPKKKEGLQVRFEEPSSGNVEEPKSSPPEGAEGDSHISRISQLTSVCADLSGVLHNASVGTDKLRSQMPVLLDELSGLIGVLCQTQQLLAKDPTCFFSKTGLAAVFDTVSSSIHAMCASTKTECSRGSKPDVPSLLAQFRNYRSTLDFLRANLEPQTTAGTSRPSVRFTRSDSFVPGHKRSLTVPVPQHSSSLIGPDVDVKKMLEEPPQPESSTEGEPLPAYSPFPAALPTTHSNMSIKRNDVSMSDVHKALSGDDSESRDALEDLLDTGIDPNAIYGRLNRSALHEAARLNRSACVDLLMDAGALVDTEDSKGDTALHLASWEGHVEACSALLSAGADIDRLSGRDGCSPLFCAIGGRHIDLVRLLLKRGARVALKSPTEMYPLHQASVTGQAATCEVLISFGAQVDVVDKERNTPLHYAATIGTIDTIRLLLNHGANVDAKQERGMTPLHWACHKGHEEAVKVLLDFGAEEDDIAEGGATPLCCAANRGHLLCVKALLKRGANWKLACQSWDNGAGTPAQLAKRNGHKDVVALLQSYGRV